MHTGPQQSIAQNKLLLLYLFRRSGLGLSELQLTRICDELAFMNYFDLKECLFELMQNNHIAEIVTPYGSLYRITENGTRIIAVLEADLRLSIRDAIDVYLAANRQALAEESQLSGSFIKLREGEYRVTLRVLEKNASVFEINLVVSSKAEAQRMVDKWRDNAVSIYRDIVLRLI